MTCPGVNIHYNIIFIFVVDSSKFWQYSLCRLRRRTLTPGGLLLSVDMEQGEPRSRGRFSRIDWSSITKLWRKKNPNWMNNNWAFALLTRIEVGRWADFRLHWHQNKFYAWLREIDFGTWWSVLGKWIKENTRVVRFYKI